MNGVSMMIIQELEMIVELKGKLNFEVLGYLYFSSRQVKAIERECHEVMERADYKMISRANLVH